ncbi:MAG: hypothetical protein RLZZ584_1520 [Pseudomonadota bacterium]
MFDPSVIDRLLATTALAWQLRPVIGPDGRPRFARAPTDTDVAAADEIHGWVGRLARHAAWSAAVAPSDGLGRLATRMLRAQPAGTAPTPVVLARRP